MPKTKKLVKLLKATRQHYTGMPVPKKYCAKYGKVYSKKEAESIGYAIAKKKGWRT